MTEPEPILPLAVVDAPPAPGADTGVRVGTVQTNNPLTVALQGGAVLNPGRISGVAATGVGQPVALLRQDGSWLCLGGLIPGLDSTRIGLGTTAGVLGQTGAEAALAASSYTVQPTCLAPPRTIMRAKLFMPMFINNATNSVHVVRLRVGAVSAAGTQLLMWQPQFNTATVTLVTSFYLEGYFKNGLDVTREVPLSLTLAAGTGSALVGAYSDANLPLVLTVEPAFSLGVNAALDARCVQV
jgi:hypothetical protein